MSQVLPEVNKIFEPFSQGDMVQLSDLTQINEFEGWAAETLLPIDDARSENYRNRLLDIWAGRECLSELIRPPKFHGHYVNLRVTPLEQAYLQLVDSFPIRRQNDEELAEANTIGFYVESDLESTGRGIVDLITNRVWLTRRSVNQSSTRSSIGPYLRKVEFPHPKLRLLEIAQAESKIIGEKVLRYAVLRPYKGGFEVSGS